MPQTPLVIGASTASPTSPLSEFQWVWSRRTERSISQPSYSPMNHLPVEDPVRDVEQIVAATWSSVLSNVVYGRRSSSSVRTCAPAARTFVPGSCQVLEALAIFAEVNIVTIPFLANPSPGQQVPTMNWLTLAMVVEGLALPLVFYLTKRLGLKRMLWVAFLGSLCGHAALTWAAAAGTSGILLRVVSCSLIGLSASLTILPYWLHVGEAVDLEESSRFKLTRPWMLAGIGLGFWVVAMRDRISDAFLIRDRHYIVCIVWIQLFLTIAFHFVFEEPSPEPASESPHTVLSERSHCTWSEIGGVSVLFLSSFTSVGIIAGCCIFSLQQHTGPWGKEIWHAAVFTGTTCMAASIASIPAGKVAYLAVDDTEGFFCCSFMSTLCWSLLLPGMGLLQDINEHATMTIFATVQVLIFSSLNALRSFALALLPRQAPRVWKPCLITAGLSTTTFGAIAGVASALVAGPSLFPKLAAAWLAMTAVVSAVGFAVCLKQTRNAES